MLIPRPHIAAAGIRAPHSGISGPFVARLAHIVGAAGAVVLLAILAGCHSMPPTEPPVATQPAPTPAPKQQRQPELAAFKAVLSGSETTPSANTSGASGELVAVLNRASGLLRWKLIYTGLSGRVRSAHFSQPGQGGKAAPSVLSIGRNLRSPYEGRAMLTPGQRDDLLAGRWYVVLRTVRFPEGELQGRMIEQR